MWKNSRPPEVVVSVPWEISRKPTPAASSCSAVSLRFFTDRLRRSSLVTTRVSPGSQVVQWLGQGGAVGQGAGEVVGEDLGAPLGGHRVVLGVGVLPNCRNASCFSQQAIRSLIPSRQDEGAVTRE